MQFDSSQIGPALYAAGYQFSVQQVGLFERYFSELQRWNQRINLTSIDDEAVISHHLLDSLSVIDQLSGHHILDLGSGGGLPGVVLAIALPDHQFTLIDARNKKIEFLKHIKRTLKLGNIHPVHGRAEQHQPDDPYETVICRAFSQLDQIYKISEPILSENGRIIAMKGRFPDEELKQIDHIGINYEVKSLDVYGLDAMRHVIIINKT